MLYDAAFKSESFDVVTMFDVIEHAVLPLELLSEVARILKPGGILAISTVNTKSMSCKILGVKWPHFKQEHLCYFSPSSIRYILHTAGFSTLEITKARKYLTLQYIKRLF